MGRILERYVEFRNAQHWLREALSLSVSGECDRYWLNSCIEMFEIVKYKIKKGL